jgi:hypothetical protein
MIDVLEERLPRGCPFIYRLPYLEEVVSALQK